jgi:hypothetical protein
VSRSWITKRCARASSTTIRNCCAVHSTVGYAVTFQCRIRRVPCVVTCPTGAESYGAEVADFGQIAPAGIFCGVQGAIAGNDFFITEVWTWRGLVTYYTVFVIDLASWRVLILGSTPHPEAVFMSQTVRTLRMAKGRAIHAPHILMCDRDRKWSGDVRRQLRDARILLVSAPGRAPNANA